MKKVLYNSVKEAFIAFPFLAMGSLLLAFLACTALA